MDQSPLRTANLVLAFLLELAMLGAWVAFGLALPLASPLPDVAASLIPLLILGGWGVFLAPKARFPLNKPLTLVLKTLLLAGGAGALFPAGYPVWGEVMLALVAVNAVLTLVWRQGNGRPGARELRRSLGALLTDYRRRHPDEVPTADRFDAFLGSGEVLQGRSNLGRHITASTWIVNPSRDKVLLTHHAKLNIWVQLGGHTDPGEDWTEAALREAREESGLTALRLAQPGLFDLDIHEIPARADTPAHEHYDLRFLVEADDEEAFTVSGESHDLAWVPLAALGQYTAEESQHRMARKTLRP
jgi:8-oxo-dGTP pyrophosphatase MutT (NUDIX family)